MPNSPRAGTHTRSLRIDDTLWARVQAAAEREDTNPSTIIRKALEAYTKNAPSPKAGGAHRAVAEVDRDDSNR